MEYARYSTALKTLSVAVLAGAVVLLGGATANAETITVTPDNISDELKIAKDGDVLELSADKSYDGDYTIEKDIDIKSAESSRAKVSGRFTIKHSGVSISGIDFKGNNKTSISLSCDIKKGCDNLDKVTIKDNKFYGAESNGSSTINGWVEQANDLNIEGNVFAKGSTSNHDIFLVSNRDSTGIRITRNKLQGIVQIRGSWDPKTFSYVTAKYNDNEWDARGNNALLLWNNKDTVLNNTTIDNKCSSNDCSDLVLIGGGNKNIKINNMTIKGIYNSAITMSAKVGWKNEESDGASPIQENHDITFNNLNITGARQNGINLYGGNSNVTINSSTINAGNTPINIKKLDSYPKGNENVRILGSTKLTSSNGKPVISVAKGGMTEGNKLSVDCNTVMNGDASNFGDSDMSSIDHQCKPNTKDDNDTKIEVTQPIDEDKSAVITAPNTGVTTDDSLSETAIAIATSVLSAVALFSYRKFARR